ncbi:MAG: nicotinate-nucleotide--dimethylbenzimidazole phosphoribosyltransferase [Elusimicrobiota bacterium]|nr:nicotinate-nucleotide--dimethylbenzimidazole phosphoribosyltransferase [Elusimicrobiota bacterium]
MAEKLKKTISKIQPVDKTLFDKTQKRLDNLTKPSGALGELEEIAKQVVAITKKENPILKNKVVFILAADHGVTEEVVSAYPKEVTPQMVYNFLRGGAGINVLSRHIGAKVIVVDIGVAEKLRVESNVIARCDIPRLSLQGNRVPEAISKTGSEQASQSQLEFIDKKINYGTKNFTKGPAMTKEEAIRSIETGIELVEEELSAKGKSASSGKNEIDIIATGDMGIGNTTPSSAITAVITGREVSEVTGHGTGIDDKILKTKIDVIKRGIQINQPAPNDPIDVLSKVGGFEIGGLAGIMLAGAQYKIPVVIDGFISGAAALIAYKLCPVAKQYFLAGHCSQEPGHKIQLEYLQLKPILNLNMRLGEGTGACLAMSIIDAACKILSEMATFESAGVSKKKRKW